MPEAQQRKLLYTARELSLLKEIWTLFVKNVE